MHWILEVQNKRSCLRLQCNIKQLLFLLHLNNPIHEVQVAHADPAKSCLSVAGLQCFVRQVELATIVEKLEFLCAIILMVDTYS